MINQANLYESLIANTGAIPRMAEPRPPKLSSAIVPWRRDADGNVEVYWVRRSPKLKFMGGWRAFPGGGLQKADAEIEASARLHGRPRALTDLPPDAGMPASDAPAAVTPNDHPGIVACALRELFEETGILPSVESGVEGEIDAEQLHTQRRRVLDAESQKRGAGAVAFADMLRDLDVHLDAERLTFAGRWLTPPIAPLRFDNRFFLLHWPASQAVQPSILPGELVEGSWVRPAAALDAWWQGDVITSPPILHLLRVLGEDGPESAAGLRRLRVPDEANLGPYRCIEFRPGVILLPLETPTLPPATHTNAFLLGTRETVLVDPGSPLPAQIEGLQAAVTDARAKRGLDIRAIWLTHHHPDHVGGVEALRRFLDVPVLAHPLTAERLAPRIRIDEHLTEEQHVTLHGTPEHAAPDMTIRVLHTPGHARGHLSFYDERWGSLLGGDITAGLGTIVVDPPEGDMDDYLASLARLRDLGARTLFPAHGPASTDPAAKFQEYIDHRLWREQRILDAWQAGQRQPADMVGSVYDDVPAVAHPVAARQLEAHLARLRKHGRL